MRKFGTSVACVALLTLGLGCTSTNINGNSSPLNVSSHANVKANLNIGGPIQGEASITRILFFESGPNKFADGVTYSMAGGEALGIFQQVLAGTDGRVKAAAAYVALTSGNADLIIDPQYEIEVENYIVYKKTTAKVRGTGATVRGYTQQ